MRGEYTGCHAPSPATPRPSQGRGLPLPAVFRPELTELRQFLDGPGTWKRLLNPESRVPSPSTSRPHLPAQHRDHLRRLTTSRRAGAPRSRRSGGSGCAPTDAYGSADPVRRHRQKCGQAPQTCLSDAGLPLLLCPPVNAYGHRHTTDEMGRTFDIQEIHVHRMTVRENVQAGRHRPQLRMRLRKVHVGRWRAADRADCRRFGDGALVGGVPPTMAPLPATVGHAPCVAQIAFPPVGAPRLLRSSGLSRGSSIVLRLPRTGTRIYLSFSVRRAIRSYHPGYLAFVVDRPTRTSPAVHTVHCSWISNSIKPP